MTDKCLQMNVYKFFFVKMTKADNERDPYENFFF